MIVAPFHSPVFVKRRLTPPNWRSAVRMTSSPTPSSAPMAMADSEFCTLWTPNIGNQADIGGADIGLRAEAVGQDTPVRQFGDHALDDGMVDAQNRKPIERDVSDKNLERLMQCRDVAVKIEVLGIDVGDDRDRRRQARKGAVAFIRLDDHPVAGTEPRVGAVSVDNAAIDDGRIEPGGLQQRADD